MYQQIKQLDESGISKFESHRHEMEEEIQKEGKEGVDQELKFRRLIWTEPGRTM